MRHGHASPGQVVRVHENGFNNMSLKADSTLEPYLLGFGTPFIHSLDALYYDSYFADHVFARSLQP